MKAPKISQTVLLAKPDSAHLTTAPDASKPGFAKTAGENHTQRDSTETTVTPINPTTAPGAGSRIRPATPRRKC